LTRAGYEHYEVSNFAQEGKASRHNQKYWTDASYYAYGAGACSYVGSTRARNVSSVSDYIEACEAGNPPVEEEYIEQPETRARNALIFGLRQIRGIEISAFEEQYGRRPESLFDGALDQYLQEGLLELSQNRLRLTHKGMLVSNEVLTSAIG
jgi:oxygen-independent coproporphyrinogen-3 oxidase